MSNIIDQQVMLEARRMREQIDILRDAVQKAADTFHDFERSLFVLQKPVMAEAAKIAKESMKEAIFQSERHGYYDKAKNP